MTEREKGEFGELLKRTGRNVTRLSNDLRTIQKTTDYTEVTITIAAGQTSGSALHGLGRAHNAAWVIGQSAVAAVAVDLPGTSTSKSTVTVRIGAALGSDLEILLRVT